MNDIDRKSFGSYFAGCFTRPGRTFASLLADGRRVRMAALAGLVPAAGYTLMYMLAWIADGAPSTFKPWLAIPIEDHFKWDIFIVAPSMFGCWVLASGSTQLGARALGGRGSFEDRATRASAQRTGFPVERPFSLPSSGSSCTRGSSWCSTADARDSPRVAHGAPVSVAGARIPRLFHSSGGPCPMRQNDTAGTPRAA